MGLPSLLGAHDQKGTEQSKNTWPVVTGGAGTTLAGNFPSYAVWSWKDIPTNLMTVYQSMASGAGSRPDRSGCQHNFYSINSSSSWAGVLSVLLRANARRRPDPTDGAHCLSMQVYY